MQKIIKSVLIERLIFFLLVVLLCVSNSIKAQSYASIPLSENFNTGLSGNWTTEPNGNGVVEARNESGPWPQFGTTTGPDGNPTGGNGLAFYNSATSVTEDISSALLYLDLSGSTGVSLEFSVVDWGTGAGTPPHYPQMSIFFSDDGGSSFGPTPSIISLNLSPHGDGFWNNANINIDAIAAANGLTLSSTSVIRFSVNLRVQGLTGTPKNWGSVFVYMDNVVINGTSSCTDRTVSPASTSPELCVNSLLTPITHATTDVSNIVSETGLPPGVSSLYSGNEITISGTPTSAGVFNY